MFGTDKCKIDVRDLTVLVVDDQDYLIRLYETALRRSGAPYTINSSTNPISAAKQLGGIRNLAVVVSDLEMPGMDGSELLRRVREMHPEATRVMVTGSGKHPAQGVAQHYLEKPGGFMKLGDTVKRGIEEYAKRRGCELNFV